MAQENCWQTLLDLLWHFWMGATQWAEEEVVVEVVEVDQWEEVGRAVVFLKSDEFWLVGEELADLALVVDRGKGSKDVD